MEQRRQQVTIMFSDVVGYTAMMGRDEEGTIRIVDQMRTLQAVMIEECGGKVVKELGDGILAYFQDAGQAVRCTVEIQNALLDAFESKIRIGLHAANVVFNKGDIFGDGVNIAARIEPLADPGGIYVSPTVVEQLDDDTSKSMQIMGLARLKGVKEPLLIYAVLDEALPEPSQPRFNQLARPRKKLALLPTAFVFITVGLLSIAFVRFFQKRAMVARAEISLKEVESLINNNWRDYYDAYHLAKEVQKILPENQEVLEFIHRSSVQVSINSEPVGAGLFYKPYDKPEDEWSFMGYTPIDSAELPITAMRFLLSEEGYDTVYTADLTFKANNLRNLNIRKMYVGQNFNWQLIPHGEQPPGMIFIPSEESNSGKVPAFYIDRTEVSNASYFEFVSLGGYRDTAYWIELREENNDQNWRKILKSFVDSTGLPGPATWKNGRYPEDKANFPVGGVSWYEAAAYARYMGKEIPTSEHWALAQGINQGMVRGYQLGGNAIIAPFSNFQTSGPVEIASLQGITPFGIHDMAGNVREWCFNRSDLGHCIRGGSWKDNHYMFTNPSRVDALDRSAVNGIRCVIYLDRKDIPLAAFGRVNHPWPWQNVPLPKPVPDAMFTQLEQYYDYDHTNLLPLVESRKINEKGWVLEKVSFNAAYNQERVIAYLFLPSIAEKPYQTILYGPGAGVLYQESSENIEEYFEFPTFLQFFVEEGRAVVFPIFKESFERGNENSPQISANFGHIGAEFLTQAVKDYRRCIDYLETREDIDTSKIAFYGMSFGPRLAQFLTAVDRRIDLNIFYASGLVHLGRPEANPVNFVPRITIPTLMINGLYDAGCRPDVEVRNVFDNLATPEKDKKLILVESDHLAPRPILVRESLAWLDQYFGPVQLNDIVMGGKPESSIEN